jgi:hypothetical protein
MRLQYIFISIGLVFLLFVSGCKNKNSKNIDPPAVKLKKHHPLKLDKNVLLGLPVKLKYDHKTDHLFILDAAQRKIFEISDSGKIVNEFGGKGKGPGEALRLDNFFATRKYLFTVDEIQQLINKYSLQDGHYISSLNYGQLLVNNKKKSKAPPAPKAAYMDNNNQPFVTSNGTVLLPVQTGGKFLYEAVNWQGKKLGNIGAVPQGYKAEVNDDQYFSALENKKIPASDLAEAFPVNDCRDHKNIYFIYPAIPKIAKYTLSGKKLWEHKVPRMPEMDSLYINLSVWAKRIRNHPKSNIAHFPIRTYIAGRCGADGDLYLSTFTNPVLPKKYRRPMWIHQFNSKGKLIKRYQIGSDVGVSFFPAVDFKNHRIFVSFLRKTGIKVYGF